MTQVQTVPGFNVLLEGVTGAGKTFCLRTLIEAGITPFIIATEPGIAASLGDIPPEKCHWHYIAPALPQWSDILANAKKINTMSFEALTQIKSIDKEKYGQFLEVVSSCANFVCDRDGKSYGSVDSWGTDRALVVDSLSGVNIMAMDLVVGAKPVKAVGDWGVAMDNLERLINRWTCGVSCHFILTAHLEREKDEVSGGTTVMVSTLGQKLAPKIPRFFDDVIQCKSEQGKFFWSTMSGQATLKSRHLPIEEKLSPDFKQIVEAWKKRGGVIAPSKV